MLIDVERESKRKDTVHSVTLTRGDVAAIMYSMGWEPIDVASFWRQAKKCKAEREAEDGIETAEEREAREDKYLELSGGY